METSTLAALIITMVITMLGTSLANQNRELGEIFETRTDVAMVTEPAAFVFTQKLFKHGKVVAFKGMFSNSSTMKFQVWRPLGNSQHLLVGEKEFTPPRIPAMLQIDLSREEQIHVQDGDQLGFAKLSADSSVVTQYDNSQSMGVVCSPWSDVSSIKVDDAVTFDPTVLPLRFSVMALYIEVEGNPPPQGGEEEEKEKEEEEKEEGEKEKEEKEEEEKEEEKEEEYYYEENYDYDEEYYNGEDKEDNDIPVPESEDHTETQMPAIPATPADEGSLFYRGASISARESVLEQQIEGTTFLLPIGMLPGGLLVKYYAYFINQEAVMLQVWREISNGIKFKLIGQVQYTPSTTGSVEIVLDEEDHIPVQKGDCIGFTIIGNTSGIGYDFNPNMEDMLRPLVATGDTKTSGGVVLNFTDLAVPYDFALGAMVDTAVVVATEDNTPHPPTTLGPQIINVEDLIVPTEPGESVLSQSLVPHLGSIDSGAARTYLMESMSFPEHAYATAFSAYVVNNGSVQFQIWRPVSWREELFELVGKVDYQVITAPGLKTIRLPDPIAVRSGDFIGYVNTGTVGVVGYVFDHQMAASALYTSAADVSVSVKQTVAFDILPFPYRFSVAVNYVSRETDSADEDSFEINRFNGVTQTPIQTAKPVSQITGVRLEQGELLIAQSMEPTFSAISRKAMRTYIVASLRFPTGGKVTSFCAFVVNNGMVQFQIWRQLAMASFELIGSKNATVTSGPGLVNVRLDNELEIQAGDMLGFANANNKGVIGYKFDRESAVGIPVFIGPVELNLAPQHQREFDLIRLPYKFSLAATYWAERTNNDTDTSASILFNPDGLTPSDLSVYPEGEPINADDGITTSDEATSAKDDLSTSHEMPSGIAEPEDGSKDSADDSEGSDGTEPSFTGLGPSDNFKGKGNVKTRQEPSPEVESTFPEVHTIPSDFPFGISGENIHHNEKDNIPALLRPLRSIYLILILLIWLIVVTLVLIGCCGFWLYKKKKKPFNYLTYRSSSSAPSILASQSGKDNDSLVRFYNSTGLLGGPGFPDSRFDSPSRRESMVSSDERTYM